MASDTDPAEGEADAEATFVVIGQPGHGKSTVMNCLAGQDIFDVANTAGSCTQAGNPEWDSKNKRTIMRKDTTLVEDQTFSYKLNLRDTPGFPDPDPKKAQEYYDSVVESCKQKLNGVIFVVKPERLPTDVLEKYATLMEEFTKLKPPIILFVNGTGPPRRKRETEEQFEERRKTTLKEYRDTAEEIQRHTEVPVRDIIVSYNMDDLDEEDGVMLDVARLLVNSEPRSSDMKTFAQLQEDLRRAEAEPDAAKELRAEKLKNLLAKQEEMMLYHKNKKLIKERQDAGEALSISDYKAMGFGFFGSIGQKLVGGTNCGQKWIKDVGKQSALRYAELEKDVKAKENELHNSLRLPEATGKLRERCQRMLNFLPRA